jgi:two-component system nitrogen regulation sensor histidine kinase NtrY
MASHERQVVTIATVIGLPALAVALVLLWSGSFEPRTQWTISTLLVLVWIGGLFALHERVVRPLQTLANMLAAIREQDYSLRSPRAHSDDALGLAMLEVNALMVELRERRLGALEATALLRRVMEEVDVAIFAFDETGALRVVNPGGERLLTLPAEQVLGRQAFELGLGACLVGNAPRVVEIALGGPNARFELRRGTFRQGGVPHQFVVLADVSGALREEERIAWQRIVRVLGHEINNSLTPIQSLAQRLQHLLGRSPPEGELREDLERGLGVIANRSASLTRFLGAYSRLAKLPPPRRAPVNVAQWVHRITRLEQRLAVEIVPSEELTLNADGDQLDQVLINLLTNAVDAALETKGGVRVRWERTDGDLALLVEDDGPGLPESANLFVPFFTTKEGGTGIGLVLSRQIVEGHGGSLALANRVGSTGAVARLVLPIGD